MKRFLNYQWIKENLAMILLVPTLLGGFWQVIELAYVRTSYIRFFSVTQLVFDGMMILFVLLLVFGISRILLWDFFEKDKPQKEHADQNAQTEPKGYPPVLDKKEKRKIYGRLLVHTGVLIVFFYFYWGSLWRPVYYADRLYTFEIPFIVFGILIPIPFIGFILKYIFTLVDVRKVIDHKAFGSFISITCIILFFAALFGLTRFIPWIHRSYLLAADFKNTEYLGCKIRKSTATLQSYSIEYFNDKYIFIELHIGKDQVKTEVLKFDEFFADTSCLNSKR